MTRDTISDRLRRLEIPFNAYGYDPYGASRREIGRFLAMLGFLYHRYLDVHVHGLQHVPPRGRAMLVGNHSGGVALDGAMVIASMFFEMDPPRLAQGMAEKFINRLPFGSLYSNRTGQLTGLPEHAVRLLHDDRLLMVFPEGSRGTAKLFSDRHSLVQFGSGFMRLALQTRAPLIPFAFLGGGEAIPTIANAYRLGRLIGAPYVPLTPYLFPIPIPGVRLDLHYSNPMTFEGKGSEDDEVIAGYVDQVKSRITALIESGRRIRREAREARASEAT